MDVQIRSKIEGWVEEQENLFLLLHSYLQLIFLKEFRFLNFLSVKKSVTEVIIELKMQINSASQ